MSQSNDSEAIVAWMQRATPGLMSTERGINVDVPAGWTHLVRETCREIGTPAWPRDGHVPPTVNAIGTHEGRLVVELAGATEEDRAIVDVARALSGETCDRCAKKGDPIEDPSGTRGCRYRDCRTPEHRLLPREWTPPWADEERARDPRADHLMRMMAANDNDDWTHRWPEMPGWTGLLRALVIAMRPEMDVRPGEGEERWILPWMKEKWGEIRMESHGRTAYQRNAEDFVETLSATLCRTCGGPATMRYCTWVRPECDTCFVQATEEDQTNDRKHRERGTAKLQQGRIVM